MRAIVFLISIFLIYEVLLSQEPNPGKFYPHNVGDRWEYYDIATGTSTYMQISKDSIGADGSHNLYYGNFFEYPRYRIDSSLNVTWMPQDTLISILYYKLPADTGEVWISSLIAEARYGWVSRIDSAYVFSKLTKVKVFRYGPSYPDSAKSRGLLEEWLAEGYGLIYSVSGNFEIFLRGCVINGDTSGIVTSVIQHGPNIPNEFLLHQNYPNPFNPTTTIEFNLSKGEEITLTVYDMLGRKVAILHKGGFTKSIKMLLAK